MHQYQPIRERETKGESMRSLNQGSSLKRLVVTGEIRNTLLMAKTVQSEVRAAAKRVIRLSSAGTPGRFFTLTAVAEDTGIAAKAIVDEIQQIQKRPRGKRAK